MAIEHGALLERIRQCRPSWRDELAAYVEAFLGLKVPDKQMCPGHDSPLDYLAYSLLGDGANGNNQTETGNRDIVVWANRGGGKTQLGAIASLIECTFLQRCQVRILGRCTAIFAARSKTDLVSLGGNRKMHQP